MCTTTRCTDAEPLQTVQESPHCAPLCEHASRGDNENHSMRRFLARNNDESRLQTTELLAASVYVRRVRNEVYQGQRDDEGRKRTRIFWKTCDVCDLH